MPVLVSTDRGELRIASPSTRVAAGLISSAVALGVAIPSVVAAAKWDLGRALSSHWRWLERLDSRPGRVASRSCWIAVDVRMRNSRGPGMRLLRLRRIDLATGGPVTVRRELIRELAMWLQRRALHRAFAPVWRGDRAKAEAVQREAKQLRLRHQDDHDAYEQAVQELFRHRPVNLFATTVPVLAELAVAWLPVLRSRRHQSLPDRLAGIVVVVGAS